MYLAQLIFVMSLLINLFSFLRFAVFALLFFDFLLKIQYEEILLEKNFKEFRNYKRHSYRLIPLVY